MGVVWRSLSSRIFLLSLAVTISVHAQQLRCPDGVPYVNEDVCDPEGVNVCPLGNRCRPATVDGQPQTNGSIVGQIRYLCCSIANMTIAQYFIESKVSPVAVPVVPLGPLASLVMRDEVTGFLVAVDSVGVDFAPTIESLLLRNNSRAGTFVQLDTVEFEYPPAEGSVLHFIVAIDAIEVPSAIALYYNYPSFGAKLLNLTEMCERYPKGFAQIIGNETVQRQQQYSEHFVILVFRTQRMFENGAQIEADVAASGGNLATFLASSSTGRFLDAPILGSLFRLRTPNTIFNVTDELPPSEARTTPAVPMTLFAVIFLLINFP